jgi:glycosyltransferase involved in cell wall biosynthesis
VKPSPAKTAAGLTPLENKPSLHNDLADDIDAVDRSGLFDDQFYARVSGAEGNRRELVRHYLMYGESELLSPSGDFDIVFYRLANPDVVKNGMSPLLHYIRHGRPEGRYPNQKRLSVDVAKIEATGLFDHRLFSHRYKAVGSSGLTDVEFYLMGDVVLPGNAFFDEEFYVDAYEDARDYPGKPLLHYIAVGMRQSRVATPEELRQRRLAMRELFDAEYYLAQFPAGERPTDPLDHYILHGARLGLDPSPDFSVDYYLRRNADISEKGIDAFYHYALHGRAEGRKARPNFSDWFKRGKRKVDRSKPTIVIANHEASRTGAPLVGLTVGAKLAERYNVIVLLGRGGPLEIDFLEYSCMVVVGQPTTLDAEYLLAEIAATHDVAAILLNSVETAEYAFGSLYAKIPSVALLHEFAEYTLPAGKMTRVVQAVDRVVVPADLIWDSVQREVAFHCGGGPANNVVVRPQGYLPQLPQHEELHDLTRHELLSVLGIDDPENTKVVLGAGFVQMRKGIDLFVQTAAEMRELWGDKVRFVWVGDGYDPGTDIYYSTWVADMVRRLDLEGHVFFLRHQASLKVLFDFADVFYLPSRLDPFPNVVLDAFKADKAVVCFDRATGVAAVLNSGEARGEAVPYCDVRAAARALIEYAQPAGDDDTRSSSRFVDETFDFDAYVQFIGEQLEIAQRLRRELTHSARRIVESDAFDLPFHDGKVARDSGGDLQRAVIEYVAHGAKGLSVCNARPGFSDGLYWNSQPNRKRDRPPLDLALTTASPPGTVPTTHRCVELDPGKWVPAFTGNAALHLHLHYTDLAADFAARLEAAKCRADLFVTTTSQQKRLEAEYAFRRYKLGRVRVIEVPNRGRDIGPLLVGAKSHLRSGNYDIIGHLHGKRSAAVDSDMGDRWRTFLTDTLLGDRDTLRQIWSLFEADRRLGLVFAEDRHSVGWTKNWTVAEKLAQRLVPPPDLPDFPMFPLGTMFWARAAALEPLWTLDFDPDDFPVEPAPYDGTILHAIERMLPAVTESTGHSWCTVYRPGSGW